MTTSLLPLPIFTSSKKKKKWATINKLVVVALLTITTKEK